MREQVVVRVLESSGEFIGVYAFLDVPSKGDNLWLPSGTYRVGDTVFYPIPNPARDDYVFIADVFVEKVYLALYESGKVAG